MNNRRIKIEIIVKEIFEKYKDKLTEQNNLSNWLDEALRRYFNTDISMEEIRKIIEEEIETKIKVGELKHLYYEKFEHIKNIANSVGNVSEDAIEDIFLMIYNTKIDSNSILDQVDKEDLTNIVLDNLKKYRNYNVSISNDVPKIIEKALKSSEANELLKSILSNEKTIRIHSEISDDATYLEHNVSRTSEVISFITKYIIIHQGEYQMDVLYNELKKADINAMSNEEMNKFFSNLILLSVQTRLGLEDTNSKESREKIAEFIKENYIEKGFCFQGSNGIYKNSILENGLTTKFSRQEDKRMQEINSIFKSRGVEKIFFSKLDETKVAPYFYITDDMSTAYHYSFHNPEWFSYFCATGNYMPDHLYDRIAYYMRDHDGCRKNIETLCSYYNLTESETNLVLSFFEDCWKEIVVENIDNSIVFVPRKVVNRNNINYNLNMSAIDIVSSLIKSHYDIDKQFYDIPKDCIYVIDVPQLYKFNNKEKIKKTNASRNILLQNGKNYVYDILIHGDKVDIDCISIVDTPDVFMSKEQTLYGKTVDIISCSNEVDENAIIENGHTSFQSLQMMIAVNGKANTEEGQKLIDKARTIYTPEYMSNYYYYLSDLFCNIALDESLSNNERASALVRLVKDIYPKAKIMKETKNYPQFISEDKNVFCYLSYRQRLLLENIEEIRATGTLEDKEIDVNGVLIELASFFKNELKDKINFNFSNEFKNKLSTFVGDDNIFEKYISSSNNFSKK